MANKMVDLFRAIYGHSGPVLTYEHVFDTRTGAGRTSKYIDLGPNDYSLVDAENDPPLLEQGKQEE